MWHDAAMTHRFKQVSGQHSSTQSELAAVLVLEGTHHADDLAILIDSAARSEASKIR